MASRGAIKIGKYQVHIGVQRAGRAGRAGQHKEWLEKVTIVLPNIIPITSVQNYRSITREAISTLSVRDPPTRRLTNVHRILMIEVLGDE